MPDSPLGESARKQSALWSEGAAEWAEMAERVEPAFWDLVLDAAGVQGGTSLLDAGCGSGGAMVRARLRGARAAGVDATEALIAEARKRMPDADLRVADMERLPFAEKSFDVAVAINSLQFTGDPRRAASEMCRVARRACAVVWAWDDCDQRAIFEAIIRLFPKPPLSRGPFALSLPGELEAAFEGFAFDTLELACTFELPSLEMALRGQMAAGPTKRSVQILGQSAVEDAIRGVLERFQRPGGEVRLAQRFRFLAARS